jgi:hypothetical protein
VHQVGAIAGSTVATLAGGSASLSKLFMMGALSPACTAVMVFGYVHLFKDHLPRYTLWLVTLLYICMFIVF